MFFNVMNYFLILSKSCRELEWVPLVPIRKRAIFEERILRIPELKNNVHVRPIFLRSPNNRLRNLLNPYVLLSDFCRIFRALRCLKPDVVIVFYSLDAYPIVILRGILGFSVFVVATGGDVNLHQGRLYTFLRRVIYGRSDMVFAVAQDLKRKILVESGYTPIVLPTGVDTSFFRTLEHRDALREKWNFDHEDILVLTVGELTKHKGADVGIRTVKLLLSRGIENLKLIVVGEGPQKDSFQNLVARLNLGGSVLFFGEKTRYELLELYNIADLFVLSSDSEGLPFVLLEAMGCGVVCICSRVGDIPDVIKEGYNGFLVDSVSPPDFSEKIEQVLCMNERDLVAIGNNARRTVLEHFNLCKIADNMMDIILHHLIYHDESSQEA